jgi:hypothetical protein
LVASRKGQRRAAAGVAVGLGEDHSRDGQLFVEGLGHPDRFLSGHRVRHEHDLLRLQFLLEPAQFVHQRVVDLQPTRGVEHHQVAGLVPRRLAPAPSDGQDVLLPRLRVDRDPDLLPQHLELFHRRRPVHVAGHQHGPPTALFLEVQGQLGRRGGLAGALQAHHQHQRGASGKGGFGGLAAQRLHQAIVENLDHLFARGHREGDLDPHGPLLDPRHERLGDVQFHVGFQQGASHVPQGIGDVFFRQPSFPAQLLHGLFEASAELFEHVAVKSNRSRPGVSSITPRDRRSPTTCAPARKEL